MGNPGREENKSNERGNIYNKNQIKIFLTFPKTSLLAKLEHHMCMRTHTCTHTQLYFGITHIFEILIDSQKIAKIIQILCIIIHFLPKDTWHTVKTRKQTLVQCHFPKVLFYVNLLHMQVCVTILVIRIHTYFINRGNCLLLSLDSYICLPYSTASP